MSYKVCDFVFILLMIINVIVNQSEDNVHNKFCQQSNNITKAYIIDDYIFLGSDYDNYIWVYSLKRNAIIVKSLDKKLEKNEMYPFDSIQTQVLFDFDPCAQYFSDDYCETARNAKHLVIVFGLYDGNYMYTSYRLNDNQTTIVAIQSNDDMPWGLSLNGSVKQTQMFNIVYDDTIYELFGLTFMTTGDKQLLMSSGINQSNSSDGYKGVIMSKSINNGSIDRNWFMEKQGIYYGLFDVNGIIYGLMENQWFNQMEWKDDELSDIAMYTEKELFNCYNNSSLITKQSQTDTDINTDITTQLSTNSYHSSFPAINRTVKDNGIKNKSSYSPKKPITGQLAILMLVLLIILGIVLTFIYFRSFRNRKRSEDEDSKSVPQTDSLGKSNPEFEDNNEQNVDKSEQIDNKSSEKDNSKQEKIEISKKNEKTSSEIVS